MRSLKFYTLFIVCSVAIFSCKNDKADTNVGGKGGNANLVLYPQHHGESKNLYNMKVYVEYNTQVPPSNGMYDDSATCTITDSVSKGIISGLKNGSYYIYARGYDSSIFQNVIGGIPYTITQQADQTVNVPVTEGD